jgi:phage gp45-like
MDIFDELRSLAERAAQRVAQYSTLAKDGAARGYDAIVHRGVQLKARRLQPYGLRSVALKGAEVVVLGINAGRSNKVYIAAEVRDHGPADLQPGEVCIYNKVSGTTIKLDKDGNVRIDAGAGKDVIVNGGSAKVSRVGDKTKGHTHTAAFNLTANLVSGAVTGTITIASATDEMAEGAEHFKG